MQAGHQRVAEVLDEALGLADPAARRAYLDRTCAGDRTLREEVESLLASHAQAGTCLDKLPTGLLNDAEFTGPATAPPGAIVRRFGDYELVEEIARGGMGVVYRARQVSLNRVVAVKMILAGALASVAEVKRFHSEAQAAASLNHPHIVGVYEVGEHEGQHYFSMPLIEGPSLAQLVESGRWQPGDGREAARLLTKAARAVHHAHQAGFLHRDLKPGNILIKPDGEPCITDFGLAKRVAGDSTLTLSGQLLGTPSFMAPEQAAGKSKSLTAAADLYSLGAVLYYLLTGRPPFVADSPLDALVLAIEGDAVLPRTINPRVPVDLQRICLRCLLKAPDARYASANDLADDLERFLKEEPLASAPLGLTRRFQAQMKRLPALVARLYAMVVCAGIVAVGYQLRHHISRSDHLKVLAVLALWASVSVACQWGLKSERWASTVRLLWAGADAASLTTILLIARALESPLVALYPALVATSGLWLRVPLVLFTTGMVVLGYGVLLVDASRRGALHAPSHWHLIALVVVILTGLSVAYLVHRVSALTGFYERRPHAQR